jgi:hypothetical protein
MQIQDFIMTGESIIKFRDKEEYVDGEDELPIRLPPV